MEKALNNNQNHPMDNIDDWEDNLLERYPDPEETTKEKEVK